MNCGFCRNTVGPGFIPFMYSTPMTIAVIESPGMPNTSAGIQAAASAELLAEVASTMPSMWPVPNFSGVLENFLETAKEIQAAMSAPAPGRAPMKTPMPEPRRKLNQYLLKTLQTPWKMLPTFCAITALRSSTVTAPRSSSDSANMPIIAGMKLMPCSSSTLPKVKRGWPAVGSMPTQLMSRPKMSEVTPLSGSPVVMKIAQVRPSSASQKYSKDEKLMAASARTGAQTMRIATPIIPPSTEKTRLTPRLRSSSPFFDMA